MERESVKQITVVKSLGSEFEAWHAQSGDKINL
jgi:hypothetical protein